MDRAGDSPLRGLRRILVSALLVALLVSCRRSKRYEAHVEITRIVAVRKDDAGKPLTVDFEVSYLECPGTQIEVLRGDAAFAACVGKYKVGDKVKVAIEHEWSQEGRYTWTVRNVGDCERVPDPEDEASFAMVRECSDGEVNGERVGLECKYVPEQKLLDKCPWFRRR